MKNNSRLDRLERKHPPLKGKQTGCAFLSLDDDGVYWDDEPGSPGAHVVPAEEVERLQRECVLVIVCRNVTWNPPETP